ncbi:MAG: AMIN domain-containing protein [candidate division Zixibacteria bacterium]|nr:AMIN domain-containing protein [candidate division Zixibacteria bacterium]
MKKLISLVFLILTISTANAKDGYQIESIVVTPDEGITRITVNGQGLLHYSKFDMQDPQRIAVDFHNTLLPEIPLNYSYHPPVKRISTQPISDMEPGVRMIVEYQDHASYNLSQSTNALNLEFTLSEETVSSDIIESEKPAWLKRKINLVVEEGETTSALTLISRQAGFDLVAAELNENSIWLNLHDVTVEDALQAIMNVSGNIYKILGDVVLVTSDSKELKDGMVSKVYRLKYTGVASIIESTKDLLSSSAVVKAISPVTTEGGSADESAKYLLISDIPEKHQLIDDILTQIDQPPSQIAISVKFIETNITDEKNLGIDWSDIVQASLSGADPYAVDGQTTTPAPYAAWSPWPLKEGSFSYGNLTVSEATAILNYLQDSGKSRLLSDPSVTTSDGKKASISVTTTIPIQTINRFSEGSVIQDIVTYDYKEVGITLSVTPNINEEGRITLVCEPTVEEITGWVGPANNQQPITTKRTVQTEVLVTEGETVVIGGLYKEGNIKNDSKIWLLGDIPILGHLFKSSNTKKNKTDLMIFITPQLVR